MGIELDVLVGHPEYELLFVATPVARAAGLKHPAESIRNARQGFGAGHQLSTLIQENCISLPTDIHGRRLRSNTVIFTESELYAMLLRGHAPQSEPFRKWVTEEVLPTIRKTGRYDASESTDPIAAGIMDELKLLRGELVELKGTICSI
ncbi:BRO-N domain-containing protein [Pseudomonas sp. UBA2628]|uniref:BRO-N domain-containing protein n=1 Tax=Pseudomonas sp. UBA2628 TaxID=1947310 RepID=UPI00257B1621|nr:BRO family protein [Pseudomonas sp. UBA2628]